LRLKATPEDFVVREATGLRIRRAPAPHRVYMLEKKDWNTADALIRIAKEKRVPYDRVGYGGKKDRHAHTFQYVTVQHPADLSLTTKGYSLKQIGYATEPMAPSLILANHFDLTVRDLDPDTARRMAENAARIQEQGLPNYFDDQRFGNIDKERGFIAEKMLQGKWEEALNMALTAIHPEEHTEAKQRKRTLRERWGDWAACREIAHSALEQRAFDLLIAKPSAYREALATAHRETATMWLSTYQSFLWNEMLRRLLAVRGWAGDTVRGVAGPYAMLAPGAALAPELMIPLPGRGMRFPDPETGELLEEILRERRLRPAGLEGEVLPGLGFRATPRPALLIPQSLHLEPPVPDDRYPDKLKLAIRFTLPRGSYATMVIKALAGA
jgi:tRNA pseudouridine13 synthase